MRVALNNGGAASESDISALEQVIGESLVPEFLEFVRCNDGAKPESNGFEIGTTNSSGVNSQTGG
jgi:hypothetical protein